MNPLTGLSTLLIALGLGFAGGDIAPEEFQKTHGLLMKGEKWASIPWKADLIQARTLAVQERKPIFIWAMDGKPLGSV